MNQSNNLLTVSFSPHIKGHYSIKNLMWGVIVALVPAITASLYFFGYNALILIAVSVLSCLFFEFMIQKYLLKRPTTISDGSAIITGILLALNVPANLPWWIIIFGSFVAIGIAKMSFGGLGNNPFNPALVGRVFLVTSFPVQMTSWPKPIVNRALFGLDAVTAATPLGILKEGVTNGISLTRLYQDLPSYGDLFIGNIGGCLGETSALALLIGFLYLLYKKIITWHIPVTVLTTAAVFSSILWFINPQRFPTPLFQILSGGIMLGAIFMATDYVTSPMTKKGMIIFGVGIGFLTILIRAFGAYPEGNSFAILIMNAFVPLINRFCKPHRFGEGRVR